MLTASKFFFNWSSLLSSPVYIFFNSQQLSLFYRIVTSLRTTDTTFHVYFAGNLRIYNCDSCCSRWYFPFNGAECSSPGSIDGAFYMRTGRSHNLHRHRHIEGHCNSIHKGKVRVGFWVGNCNKGHKNADASTGWAEVSRIFIEEVPKAQQ